MHTSPPTPIQKSGQRTRSSSEKKSLLTANSSKCIVVQYSDSGCISRTSIRLFWLNILSPGKIGSLVLKEESIGRSLKFMWQNHIGLQGEGNGGGEEGRMAQGMGGQSEGQREGERGRERGERR